MENRKPAPTGNARHSSKVREWLRRYIPAEILGTVGALVAAWVVYGRSHSYIAAAASGWTGEGIAFYGYFIIAELLGGGRKYRQLSPLKRIFAAVAAASTNLIVEFMPAEIVDGFIIRPFAMYAAPHYIHPYPLGFLAGKFSADIIFYTFAIVGYEARKHWLHR